MKNERNHVYLIDMDGTLYKGLTPIKYSKEFIEYLQRNNRKFLLMTNCPGSTSDDLVIKLATMGIKVNRENILTSGQVTASYVSSNKIASRVYLIGSAALEEELEKAGMQVVEEDPDCVVVGFDKAFNYEKMKKAIAFINSGAGFIVTNGDHTIPEGIEIVPHTGAIAAGIEMATGVKPLVIGKPERFMLDAAKDILNCSIEDCCVIGDRLDTDIAFGNNIGSNSYLVMTGVTTYELLEKSELRPTRVFENLYEVMLSEDLM